MTDIKFHLVGGAVRDRLMNVPCKDYDYTVTGFQDFNLLIGYLTRKRYQIVHIYDDKYTVRAKNPNGEYCDYVWARKDGPYVDGDLLYVEPGSLYDDLSRRDFTINAMAIGEDGELIDYFGGENHVKQKILKTVGKAEYRFLEDPRRLTRGLRFMVKYDLTMDLDTLLCYSNERVLDLFSKPKFRDKIKEELDKSFKLNPLRTLNFLADNKPFSKALFEGHGLYLMTSSKKR